ncbi:glycosyltransferase family 2 protein [Pseudofrankia sp. DC12]|uniref:glycosyltransferase family 2 protein n=1 Tax=Pseudofrankia sp. DC12 TaxID=683315 RepID=UPI001E40A571|nr:glycosyltransferase family 2 protein [Pseudofrankia sp. DC12]
MTESRVPEVSIGIPVYNGADFLGAAIESHLAQTFGDFELVISDNASTDGTEELCRRFAKEDSRVRYLRQAENIGANANYNEVARISRGRFFRWAADDDVLLPEYLERTYDLLSMRRHAEGARGCLDRLGLAVGKQQHAVQHVERLVEPVVGVWHRPREQRRNEHLRGGQGVHSWRRLGEHRHRLSGVKEGAGIHRADNRAISHGPRLSQPARRPAPAQAARRGAHRPGARGDQTVCQAVTRPRGSAHGASGSGARRVLPAGRAGAVLGHVLPGGRRREGRPGGR